MRFRQVASVLFVIFSAWPVTAQEVGSYLNMHVSLGGSEGETINPALRDVAFRQALAVAIDPYVLRREGVSDEVALNASMLDDWACAAPEVRAADRGKAVARYGELTGFLDAELADYGFRSGQSEVNRRALRAASRRLAESGYTLGEAGFLQDPGGGDVVIELRVAGRDGTLPAFEEAIFSEALVTGIISSIERLGIRVVDAQSPYRARDIVEITAFSARGTAALLKISENWGLFFPPLVEGDRQQADQGEQVLRCQRLYMLEAMSLMVPLLVRR